MVSPRFFVGAWYVDEFVRTEKDVSHRNEECSYFNLPMILKPKNHINNLTLKKQFYFLFSLVLRAAITLKL